MLLQLLLAPANDKVGKTTGSGVLKTIVKVWIHTGKQEEVGESISQCNVQVFPRFSWCGDIGSPKVYLNGGEYKLCRELVRRNGTQLEELASAYNKFQYRKVNKKFQQEVRDVAVIELHNRRMVKC